jgi:hypothetical protein
MDEKRVKVVAGLATAALGAAASAQVDGTATWLWEVTTESGDAIVEPGETATITLSVDMSPDVNFPGGPVLGLAYAEFDTLGARNADMGTIEGWDVLGHLDDIFGDQTTTDGVNLFGTVAVQPLDDLFDPSDPIDVLRFTWAPQQISEYGVAYNTNTILLKVAEIDGTFDWTVVEASISFSVVPGGGSTIPVFMFVAFLGIRRRRYAWMRRGAPRQPVHS